MMIMTRVLVVEDSPDIARLVQRSLLLEGYEVDVANDGRSALAVVRDTPPDLIVLDLMLPDIDGMEICRRVRAMEAAYEQPPVPVLMLTALDAVPDRVSGLDAGADDYVPKPFAITELMARVRSLLRRSRAPEMRSKQREIITFDDLTLDLLGHRLSVRVLRGIPRRVLLPVPRSGPGLRSGTVPAGCRRRRLRRYSSRVPG